MPRWSIAAARIAQCPATAPVHASARSPRRGERAGRVDVVGQAGGIGELFEQLRLGEANPGLRAGDVDAGLPGVSIGPGDDRAIVVAEHSGDPRAGGRTEPHPPESLYGVRRARGRQLASVERALLQTTPRARPSDSRARPSAPARRSSRRRPRRLGPARRSGRRGGAGHATARRCHLPRQGLPIRHRLCRHSPRRQGGMMRRRARSRGAPSRHARPGAALHCRHRAGHRSVRRRRRRRGRRW